MKRLNTFLVISLIMSFPSLAITGPDGDDSLAEKAGQLDQQCFKSLQIGINSVRWLLGASENSYLFYPSLVKENQVDAIKALEERGYARLELTDKLPWGQEQGPFLQIIPTAKGQSVIKALANLPDRSTDGPVVLGWQIR